MSLREIAAGEVSFDNIKELRAPEPEVESVTEEVTAEETTE